MLKNKIFIYLFPILSLLALEVFISYPKSIYFSVVLLSVLVIFIFKSFTKNSIVDKNSRNYVIFPIIFLISLSSFISAIPIGFMQHILIVLFTLIVLLYFRITYKYLIHPSAYREFSLPNITSYGNFLTFFFASASIFNFQSFLGIDIWKLMIFLLILSLAVFNQILWVNGVKKEPKTVFSWIGSLIILEIGWSLSFLPLSYLVSGFILSICYYILAGLIRHYLAEKLNGNAVRLYLGFGFLCIIIILLTSRWI